MNTWSAIPLILITSIRDVFCYLCRFPYHWLSQFVCKLICHQERSSLVIKALSEAEWRHVCVVTMTRFRELCGSTETADVLIAVLINQGRACLLKLDGKENIEVSIWQLCASLVFNLCIIAVLLVSHLFGLASVERYYSVENAHYYCQVKIATYLQVWVFTGKLYIAVYSTS